MTNYRIISIYTEKRLQLRLYQYKLFASVQVYQYKLFASVLSFRRPPYTTTTTPHHTQATTQSSILTVVHGQNDCLAGCPDVCLLQEEAVPVVLNGLLYTIQGKVWGLVLLLQGIVEQFGGLCPAVEGLEQHQTVYTIIHYVQYSISTANTQGYKRSTCIWGLGFNYTVKVNG